MKVKSSYSSPSLPPQKGLMLSFLSSLSSTLHRECFRLPHGFCSLITLAFTHLLIAVRETLGANAKAPWLFLSVPQHMIWSNVHSTCDHLQREEGQAYRPPSVGTMVIVIDLGHTKSVYSHNTEIDPYMHTSLTIQNKLRALGGLQDLNISDDMI